MAAQKNGSKRPQMDPKLLNKLLFLLIIVIAGYIVLNHDLLNPEPESGEPASVDTIKEEIKIHFIDVGQGDSILIQSPEHTVLIDAGELSALKTVEKYISDLDITVLDYVIATHPDSDHIGAMAGIIDRFEVHNVWMPDVMHTTATFERLLNAIESEGLEWVPIKAGAELSLGLIQMKAVAPNGDSYTGRNNYSIVLRMVYGETAFLFTGDAELQSEREMLEEGWDLRADVLKVGHHGSHSSSSGDFLDAVQPQIAVISCKTGNSYGHPHRETMESLNERNINVLRTDEMGTIVLSTDGEYIYIYDPPAE